MLPTLFAYFLAENMSLSHKVGDGNTDVVLVRMRTKEAEKQVFGVM